MKKFFIIAHTHWDREWYMTYQENRVRLVKFMDDLLDTLEKDISFTCFTLDGQTSLINDYLDIKPKNKERIAKLIKSGKMLVGPWFVQPDENIPSGESLIRNLLISKNISDEFGDYLKVGYLPDSFGQSAVMPTVLKGFGIDSAVFYRGLASEDTPYNEFLWKGLDGSEVIASWMPSGYGNAMFLSEETDKSVIEIERNIRNLGSRSINGNILLMSGSDQCFPKKFLPDISIKLNEYYKSLNKDYNFAITSLEDYITELRPYRDKMTVLEGEFRKGKHSRTHISISGTRMDVKKKNFLVERKYTNLLEPLIALTSLQDNENEKEITNRGWKYIIENHAHDSICCCCTDTVHKEMLGRLGYAEQIADTIIKNKFEKLHSLISYEKDKGTPIIILSSFLGSRHNLTKAQIYVKSSDFTIVDGLGREVSYIINNEKSINLKDMIVSFSPVPDDFYRKLDIEFYADIYGVGYKTYYIREGEMPKEESEKLLKGNILENKYIKAEVMEDGSIEITDKVNLVIYKKQHIFKETGNAGDEYDYSPSYNDSTFTSENCLKSIDIVSDTLIKAELRLDYVMSVPKTTYADKRSDELAELNISTYMSIYRDDKNIYFNTRINNNAENHRIQIVFDYGDKLEKHFADSQFGILERENQSPLTEISENETWSERYYAIYNQHNFCGVKNCEGKGFIIANKGLPQYEVDNGETTKLCITLLSGVGYMGNENLKYRKGRRSGAFCGTPDAEMLGEFDTEYSFMPFSKYDNFYSQAECYINPIYAFSSPKYECDGVYPANNTLASSGDGLQLSAFKAAEDCNGYILRVFNPTANSKNDIELKVNKHIFSGIKSVNLAETVVLDNNSKIEKQNNPDNSNESQLNGIIKINLINRNAVYSYRLSKCK